MKEKRDVVPGEGNLVYPTDDEAPVQGEVKDPKKGLKAEEEDDDKEK